MKSVFRSTFSSSLVLAIIGAGLLVGCQQLRPTQAPGADIDAPEVPREFRAAWIATVANIDWPSEPGLPVEAQKDELRALLDEAEALNLNAVIFQVRPHADALYDSPHEPWSFYLTGEQGRPPSPCYDPLQFAVEEAHARGLELHAWFNPYRAGHPADSSTLADTHLKNRQPSWVRAYGDYLWLDPGHPDVQDHTHRVIMDVVRRYDIDGVHFDDYFYPYPSYDEGASFPDSASWARAQHDGWDGSRDDWRRDNVDRLVERVYRSIKDTKPHVKFGISPFGIWRPDHPPGTEGFDAYAALYADARRWLREGWVDYLTPQLYYRLDQFGYSYPEMLRWWIEQNDEDRHIWPGLYTSRLRMDGDRHWSDRQLLGQIHTARSHPEATGQVHFSMKALMPLSDSVQAPGPPDTTILAPIPDTLTADTVFVDGRPTDSATVDSVHTDSVSVVHTKKPPRALRATKRFRERLRTGPYASPALVPASPWLDDDAPGRPLVAAQKRDTSLTLTLTPSEDEPVQWWVVQWRRDAEWEHTILPGSQSSYTLPIPGDRTSIEAVAVSAVDRFGNMSPPAAPRHSSSQ